MKNRTVKIFSNIEKLANHSADFLMEKINNHTSKTNFSIVLSGGSTPKKIFKYISDNYTDKINWENCNVFFGDERCVPPDNDESNFKMVNDILFRNSLIPSKNIFRIKGEDNPIDEARRYSEIIRNNVKCKNNIPQFDIIMLGLGEDGHTASIFPNEIELFYSNNFCEVATHTESGQNRITITGPIINNAKLVVFFVTGKNKVQIVSELFLKKKTEITYPASLVNPVKGKLIWLLDTEASQLLEN